MVRARRHARPLDQGLHPGGDVGKVGWGAEENAVGRPHLVDALIDDIAGHRAVAVGLLETLVAGPTSGNVLPRERDEFRLDAFFPELIQNHVQQDGRVPVRAGTAVECDDFHDPPPRHSIDFCKSPPVP